MNITRCARGLALSVILGVLALLGAQPAYAAADTTYTPSTGWNGLTIYLSTACHNGSGTTCIDNVGCSGFSENGKSDLAALYITTVNSGSGSSVGLLHRGFRVIVGQGTVSQNIARSNAAGARLHIPLHSNAVTNVGSCGGPTTASTYGTWVLYYSTNGSRCSTAIKNRLGPLSPGTSDKIVYRNNLGELTSTYATACYLESEFHTWPTGATWLTNSLSWSGAVALGVDTYLGFP